MEVKVAKLTHLSLLQKANSFTTGRDSKMDLAKAYKFGHSPIRTQLFWIEMRDIPLFVASHLVRSHVGIQCFQLSKRPDRGGKDFKQVCEDISNKVNTIPYIDSGYVYSEAVETISEMINDLPYEFDRYAPPDLACIINAEAIINMSHKRLCAKASAETREIWGKIVEEIRKCDRDLANYCVKPCVHCGFCREAKPCGFTKTDIYQILREDYLKLFS